MDRITGEKMTDRTKEMLKQICKDDECAHPHCWGVRAYLKGRQEMRDEIREWILENWACCGCGLCMNDHRAEIEFDAKFGDKK